MESSAEVNSSSSENLLQQNTKMKLKEETDPLEIEEPPKLKDDMDQKSMKINLEDKNGLEDLVTEIQGLNLEEPKNNEIKSTYLITIPENSTQTEETTNSETLISRGPIGTSYLTNHRPQPYATTILDPQDPQTRRRSSGGSVHIIPQVLAIQQDLTRHQTTVCPNRQLYMHKNGGGIQIASAAIIPSQNFPPSPEYSLSPSPYSSMSVSPASVPPQSLSPASSISMASPCSVETTTSEVLSDLSDFEIWSGSPDGDDGDLELNSIIEDALDMDSEYVTDGKNKEKTDNLIYKMIEGQQNDVKLNGEVLNNLNDVATVVANGGVSVQPLEQSSVLLIISNCTSLNESVRTPRAILPKPKPQLENDSKQKPVGYGLKELREMILSKYPEDMKRRIHCNITQRSDEDLDIDSDGDTQLHIAITNRKELASIYLIDRFASSNTLSLDSANNKKATPLFCAVATNQKAVVDYLLAKGANPNALSPWSKGNVLHFAAQRGLEYFDIVKILARHPKIELNAYDSSGRTPLLVAIENHGRGNVDSTATVQFLLQIGASLTHQDHKSGKTAVHLAVEMKALDILQILCKEGEQISEVVNKPNFAGLTPLHIAASLTECDQREQLQLVKMLLDSGACARLTNRQHKSPGDLVEKERREVKKLLMNRRGSK